MVGCGIKQRPVIPEQRQLEQSRRGECYSATWGVRSTLARPQGTHAGQLPANTAIYCDTPCPPRTFTTFILSAIWQYYFTTHFIALNFEMSVNE